MSVKVRGGYPSHLEVSFDGGRIVLDVVGTGRPTREAWRGLADAIAHAIERGLPDKLTWADLGLPEPGAMHPNDIGQP